MTRCLISKLVQEKEHREEEETRRAEADKRKWKQEYLDRKRGKVVNIPENIMLPKKSYGNKHMLQTRGAWLNLRTKCSRDCMTQS